LGEVFKKIIYMIIHCNILLKYIYIYIYFNFQMKDSKNIMGIFQDKKSHKWVGVVLISVDAPMKACIIACLKLKNWTYKSKQDKMHVLIFGFLNIIFSIYNANFFLKIVQELICASYSGSFFATLWTFCIMYSIQMLWMHCPIINLTKIFMD